MRAFPHPRSAIALVLVCASLACGAKKAEPELPPPAAFAPVEAVADPAADASAAAKGTVATAPGAKGPAECLSLQGEPLFRPVKSPTEALEDETRVEAARKEAVAAPDDPAKWVWYGRMLGNAGRFREAMEAFEVGVKRFPDDPRMYRHLGHRQITMRRFEDAVRTLEKAASLAKDMADELEPPTKVGGAQIDTLKQNIYYHLGLGHFFSGNYAKAEAAFASCRELSNNPDSLCSATHWLWMTLSREGKHVEAKAALERVPPELKVVEYHAYRDLCSLYRGELDGGQHFQSLDPKGVDYATFGFGFGSWHLAQGTKERALDVFRAIAKADAWMAFGRIGSEVELKRLAR